ncbi:MAG: hypothetical protein GQ574_17960 [Crocinitomix sp.]|nr:hypothetical protein [Crocinitomix sp.]
MKTRYIILLTITFLIFSCANPEKIELTKAISIDWTNRNELEKYEVLYVQLNFSPFLDEEIAGHGIEEFIYKDSIYILDNIDQTNLTEIILDSSNFSRGECGNFALNGGFIFTQNDTIKGIIEMGCGYSQWSFESWNENVLDGSLSDIGFEKMSDVLDDINLKMN